MLNYVAFSRNTPPTEDNTNGGVEYMIYEITDNKFSAAYDACLSPTAKTLLTSKQAVVDRVREILAMPKMQTPDDVVERWSSDNAHSTLWIVAADATRNIDKIKKDKIYARVIFQSCDDIF